MFWRRTKSKCTENCTVPELATHWHSRSPPSKFHASSAVLGWGLATAGSIGMAPSHLQIFYTFSPANFSPAVLGWRLLTCSFFLADFSHAVLGRHRPGLPNSPQKKSMESWRFCHNVYMSPVENAKFTENKNDQRNRGINLSYKMQRSPNTKMINAIMLQIVR